MWLAPCGMVQLVSRVIFWKDSEYAPEICIADLYPCYRQINPGIRRWSGDLVQMIWSIHHLGLFCEWIQDLKRIFTYLTCSPWYSCFSVITQIRLTMSKPACDNLYIIWAQISRQFWIWSQNFNFISVSCIIVILLLAKLDSAIVDVPTNRNVSTASIY